MSVRAKIILIGVLLCISLAVAVLAAASTYSAYQNLQQQHMLARSGDVRTIRSWMTIPYIARVYRVPEDYLYQSLHVQHTSLPPHATLIIISDHLHKPVDSIVQRVQSTILTYRKQHHVQPPVYHAPPRAIILQNGATCQ